MFFSLHAQDIIRFRHITINEGLAHTDATCFTQDHLGFIWIGTNSGLQQYDGQQLRLFSNDQSPLDKVYKNRITSLCAKDDFIWVGSENGIHLFDLRKELFIPLECNLQFDDFEGAIKNITNIDDQIYFIQNNKAFVAYYSVADNFLTIKELQNEIENLPDSFSEYNVRSITHDGAKNIWIGTNKGIIGVKIQNNKYSYNNFWGQMNPIANLKFSPLLLTYNGGKLWVYSRGELFIFSVNSQTGKCQSKIKNILIEKQVVAAMDVPDLAMFSEMKIDHKENFWLGTIRGLVHIRNPLAVEPQIHLYRSTLSDPFSLASNHISSIFEDRTQCLWVSSWGGGVSWIDLEKKKFELITPNYNDEQENIENTFIRAIVGDRNGNIWLGTRNKGIIIYDPIKNTYSSVYKNVPINNRLTNKEIRSLHISKEKLYIGTTDGLNVLDLGSGVIYNYSSSELKLNGKNSNSAIFSIVSDINDNVWLASWGSGISKISIENNKLTKVQLFNSSPLSSELISSDKINFLYYDKEKNEVLASTNKGLNRMILDDNCEINELIIYRGFEGEGSFSSDYLWPIVKESDSVYWIGTLGGGLNRFEIKEGKTFNNLGKYSATSFNRANGAPSNDIETLLMDNNGYLWIGSKGLSRFDPKTSGFWNFDVNDGLQSDGFKIGSAYKSQNGYFYFGGINGANYFNPEEITSNYTNTQVVLTDLKVHNNIVGINDVDYDNEILKEGISYVNSIELDYTENDFSISFASLHFANPQKCKYKYLLEGYDKDWHIISSEYPKANYANLDYGTYVFKVDATNNDGVWSNSPRELRIEINPPWWKSNWAYVLYVFLFFAFDFLIFMYLARWIKMRNDIKIIEAKEIKKEELHQMKLQFFTNISHEFKTPLTLILTPVERLISNNNIVEDERMKLLRMIKFNADRLNDLIHELLDFRKAETGNEKVRASIFNFEEFLSGIYEQFADEMNSKEIDFTLNKGECSTVLLLSDVSMISKITLNVISNAIKFTSNKGYITVDFFTVQKNGIIPKYKYSYFIESEIQASEYLVLRISDSGIGISADSINQVFDRYFQLKSNNKNHLGSGIGLAYVKSLMLLLKGNIILSSERNVGTEFLLCFPLGESHFLSGEIENAILERNNTLSKIKTDSRFEKELNMGLDESDSFNEDENDQRKIMLIVEDNEELRGLLKNHFHSNYLILEASNGVEAIHLLDQKIPDIILSDIMMPEMDGLEMCKKIRDNLITSHLPIVLLTAKSSIENQIEGTEHGADLYVSKPFSIQLLDLQIKKLLETHNELRRKFTGDIYADNREIAQTQKDKVLLDKFIEFVDVNMSNEDFDVDSLCRELNIGRTNLYKKIRSLTGMAMGAFIRSLRLKKAARILKTEDITISEVLFRIGISSNSYFTKSFKEQFGVTPSEFISKRDIIDND